MCGYQTVELKLHQNPLFDSKPQHMYHVYNAKSVHKRMQTNLIHAGVTHQNPFLHPKQYITIMNYDSNPSWKIKTMVRHGQTLLDRQQSHI